MNQVDKWFASVYEGFSIIPMCMRKPSTRVLSGPYTSLPIRIGDCDSDYNLLENMSSNFTR